MWDQPSIALAKRPQGRAGIGGPLSPWRGRLPRKTKQERRNGPHWIVDPREKVNGWGDLKGAAPGHPRGLGEAEGL